MGEEIQKTFDNVQEKKGELGVDKLVQKTSITRDQASKVSDDRLDEVRDAANEILDEKMTVD